MKDNVDYAKIIHEKFVRRELVQISQNLSEDSMDDTTEKPGETIIQDTEKLLFDEKAIVFGNLPYNISTEILIKWIINLKNYFWFECTTIKPRLEFNVVKSALNFLFF